MKKLSAPFAILLLVFGLNCTKTGYISCEAFNSPLFDQWVPYRANATYNFSTGTNAESYVIRTMFRQAKEQQVKTANNKECPPWAHIEGSIGNNGSLSFDALSNSGNASGTIVFRGVGFKFTAIADTGFVTAPLLYQTVTKFNSEIILEGKSFKNVQIITPLYDPASPGSLKALYFQKGLGLVAYTVNTDTFVIK